MQQERGGRWRLPVCMCGSSRHPPSRPMIPPATLHRPFLDGMSIQDFTYMPKARRCADRCSLRRPRLTRAVPRCKHSALSIASTGPRPLLLPFLAHSRHSTSSTTANRGLTVDISDERNKPYWAAKKQVFRPQSTRTYPLRQVLLLSF